MNIDRALVALALAIGLVVFLADAYLFPGAVVPAAFYAVPILLVAYLPTPRRVAGVAVLTLSLESLSAALERTPLSQWAADTLALALVAYLAVVLAGRTRREAALARERMALLGRAEADATERRAADEEREQLLARERALARIGQALVREQELERVAELVAEQSVEVLGADSVALWLADPTRRELNLVAHRNITPQSVEVARCLSYDAPFLSARAARTEEIQIVEDLLAVEVPPAAREFYEREGFRSVLTAPLLSRGRLVGVVNHSTRTRRRFTPQDVEFNSTVANLFAVAIENAQLFERVREALRLREEFLAAAAHELKTPVTTIKGYSQTLRSWTAGRLEPREDRALEVINVQCDRLAQRLHEMLELAQFRAAPPALRRVRFDLGELAAEVAQRAQSLGNTHTLTVQREGPAPVDADRERVEEVLASLLDNAVKYSPDGRDVEVRVATEGGEAVASVRDHGVGIARERQPHVFDPFYESVPTGTPGYHGVVTLSLYLSKLTVEHHQGRIWFESEPGQGSTFHFSLPLATDPS